MIKILENKINRQRQITLTNSCGLCFLLKKLLVESRFIGHQITDSTRLIAPRIPPLDAL